MLHVAHHLTLQHLQARKHVLVYRNDGLDGAVVQCCARCVSV